MLDETWARGDRRETLATKYSLGKVILESNRITAGDLVLPECVPSRKVPTSCLQLAPPSRWSY